MIRGALLQELGNGRLELEQRSLVAGLEQRQIPVRFFLEKQLQRRQLQLSRDILVAGHIPTVLNALRKLGIEPPRPNDYPASLRPWLHRRIWTSTVKDMVMKLQEGATKPFFAKPLGKHKRFRGHVFESWDDLRALGGASDRAQVICCEIVQWTTEYRAYVIRGQIVGLRHYTGDPQVSADREVIERAVAEFEASGEAPAGYGIDFGVMADGRTALVEVNDGYALGSYGLEDSLYTDLIVTRWCELTGGGKVVDEDNDVVSGQ